MISLFIIIDMVIGLYMWVLIISAILSWLIAFNIVNTRNQFVLGIADFLARVTEPALRPIRKMVPLMNGIDLSPLVLYFALMFLRLLIRNNLPMMGIY
ncbi:MAG: YggT family protein [Alphaproteobacteria bacterium]